MKGQKHLNADTGSYSRGHGVPDLLPGTVPRLSRIKRHVTRRCLIAVAKQGILLVRHVDLFLTRVNNLTLRLAVSSSVIKITEQPVQNNKTQEYDPDDNGGNEGFEIARRLRPELRASHGADTVADEVHGVDNGALRVAFDVRCGQTEHYSHDTGDAGGLAEKIMS